MHRPKILSLILILCLSSQAMLASGADGSSSGKEITLETLQENQKTLMGQATILIFLTTGTIVSFCCFLCFMRNGYIHGNTQQPTPDIGGRSRGPSSFEMGEVGAARALAGSNGASPRGGDRA